MTPSWTQPPNKAASPMATKTSTERTNVAPMRRSSCFITWYSDILCGFTTAIVHAIPWPGLAPSSAGLYQDPPCRLYPDGITLSDWDARRIFGTIGSNGLQRNRLGL